jgi:hypothetical protein
MDANKEFRKQVLRTHYDISGGLPINPVERQAVANALGINDYNDSMLLGAIQYLNGKRYLEPEVLSS